MELGCDVAGCEHAAALPRRMACLADAQRDGIVDEYVIRDDSNRGVYSGTTLRAFDTNSASWTIRYIDQWGARTGRWAELVGTKVGDEMHVEQRGRTADGATAILKIRYYAIEPNHFRWAAD